MSINTHKMVKDLVEAGQEERIAEAEVQAMRDFFEDIPMKEWIRAEHANLKTDIHALMQIGFADQNEKLSQFSVDMRTDFAEFKSDMRTDFAEVRATVKTLSWTTALVVVATGSLAMMVMDFH